MSGMSGLVQCCHKAMGSVEWHGHIAPLLASPLTCTDLDLIGNARAFENVLQGVLVRRGGMCCNNLGFVQDEWPAGTLWHVPLSQPDEKCALECFYIIYNALGSPLAGRPELRVWLASYSMMQDMKLCNLGIAAGARVAAGAASFAGAQMLKIMRG